MITSLPSCILSRTVGPNKRRCAAAGHEQTASASSQAVWLPSLTTGVREWKHNTTQQNNTKHTCRIKIRESQTSVRFATNQVPSAVASRRWGPDALAASALPGATACNWHPEISQSSAIQLGTSLDELHGIITMATSVGSYSDELGIPWNQPITMGS